MWSIVPVDWMVECSKAFQGLLAVEGSWVLLPGKGYWILGGGCKSQYVGGQESRGTLWVIDESFAVGGKQNRSMLFLLVQSLAG